MASSFVRVSLRNGRWGKAALSMDNRHPRRHEIKKSVYFYSCFRSAVWPMLISLGKILSRPCVFSEVPIRISSDSNKKIETTCDQVGKRIAQGKFNEWVNDSALRRDESFSHIKYYAVWYQVIPFDSFEAVNPLAPHRFLQVRSRMVDVKTSPPRGVISAEYFINAFS